MRKKKITVTLDGRKYVWVVDGTFQPSQKDICDWLHRVHGIRKMTPNDDTGIPMLPDPQEIQ